MIIGVNHVTLAVADIMRSFNFYHDVLGLKALCRWDKGAYFLVGDFWFCLNLDPKRKPGECYTHYAFTVSQPDFDKMRQRLIQAGIASFKENTSPGDSFYFLDPDGHLLELHTGDWQSRVAAKKAELGAWQDVAWYI